MNYYALKIIWNHGCASAHQLKRRFEVNTSKEEHYYELINTTASLPVRNLRKAPFIFSIVLSALEHKRNTSTNFAL